MKVQKFIKECQEKVFSGNGLSFEEAHELFNIPDENLKDLAQCANEITRDFNGQKVDVEQLNNIKKNACSEDCTFCGQSAFFDTGIETYQLPSPEEVVLKAEKAKQEGAESYCLVAAWREPSPKDFEKVCKIISQINNKVGISVECSLGFLIKEQAEKLKKLNVKRYNHNLETAKSKFSEICTTHTYEDRLNTLKIARDAGLELCTGGIIGLGETREQRFELTMELARIYPEEVTINILVPVPGTPLELQTQLPNSEIVRIFAVIRFLLPESVIKISGGRELNLEDSGEELLQSGANGIITSGYLTMGGNEAKKDREMIEKIGLKA
ncbi:MAG: biotin synthase BioB [Nitrosopumilus sp.]|uniref:biotin synthase BioB n=1 Tax=Nitrosopumilus sp. TaxID=2024843 RepID=UPI00247C986D|nr:biotin synthase BioB [Nitrosopumilus sp.]MCV0392211.1 biotin synthase BioB [Nitrosopumilus sp.]